jgi:hypothetical protein
MLNLYYHIYYHIKHSIIHLISQFLFAGLIHSPLVIRSPRHHLFLAVLLQTLSKKEVGVVFEQRCNFQKSEVNQTEVAIGTELKDSVTTGKTNDNL